MTSKWFDESSNASLIAEQAQRLDSYLSAMADGKVEASELKDQEARVVKLMKEVEPLLSEQIHAKVTQLLCELTAYDLMQYSHMLHAARPKTVFRG